MTSQMLWSLCIRTEIQSKKRAVDRFHLDSVWVNWRIWVEWVRIANPWTVQNLVESDSIVWAATQHLHDKFPALLADLRPFMNKQVPAGYFLQKNLSVNQRETGVTISIALIISSSERSPLGGSNGNFPNTM